MRIINFSYKDKKTFAEIEWKSGKTSKVQFGIEGVTLWIGAPQKLKDQVKEILVSDETLNFLSTRWYEKNIGYDNRWLYKKLENNLYSLRTGFPVVDNRNISFRKSKLDDKLGRWF